MLGTGESSAGRLVFFLGGGGGGGGGCHTGSVVEFVLRFGGHSC